MFRLDREPRCRQSFLGPNVRDRLVLLAPEPIAGLRVFLVIEPCPGVVGGKPGQALREQLLITVFAKSHRRLAGRRSQ